MIDFDDFEYAIPGEHLRTAADYDLRTYDQRTDARLADHERRIIVLEHRLRHIERLVHRMLNATTKAVDMEQSG